MLANIAIVVNKQNKKKINGNGINKNKKKSPFISSFDKFKAVNVSHIVNIINAIIAAHFLFSFFSNMIYINFIYKVVCSFINIKILNITPNPLYP